MELKVSRVTVVAALLTMIILVILGTGNKPTSNRAESSPKRPLTASPPLGNFTPDQRDRAHARAEERLANMREERQKAAYDAYKNAGGQA
jgi:hypothetical protein